MPRATVTARADLLRIAARMQGDADRLWAVLGSKHADLFRADEPMTVTRARNLIGILVEQLRRPLKNHTA